MGSFDWRGSGQLHPAAWWVWALGAAAAVSTTTNPLLLGLLVAAVCVVVVARRSDAPWALSFRLYLMLAAVVVVFRVVFRVVFGAAYVAADEHVALDLPTVPLPDWTAGVTLLGPVTWESLQSGFSDGLRLGALIVCVGAANTLADPRRLLASLPPALYEVAAAVVIALSMFPQLAESVQRVRRARVLRGDPGQGVSALRRVLVPVLEDAFERSLHLAASMDARGYGRTGDQSPNARRTSGALLLLGLLGLGVGSYGLLDSSAPRVLSTPMVVAGLMFAVGGVALAGRRVRRTRHRPDRWSAAGVVVAASGVAAAVLMRVAGTGRPDVLLPDPGMALAGHLPGSGGGAGAAAGPPGDPPARGRTGTTRERRGPGAGRPTWRWTVIEWRDVSVRYDTEGTDDPRSPDGARPAVLEHVDLRIDEAELVLVAGRTGSGKSTLLRTVNGLVPRFTGGRVTGEVSVAGRQVRHSPPRDLAHLVGYVGQDPASTFVTSRVEDELAYGMEQLGLAPATMRRRVEETLDLLGLADLRERGLRSLSGGQQQRVAIGAVLTMHPRVLVLDEPTSALDPVAAEDVLGTLARLVDDLALTVLLAEHRMERVVPFIDRMVVVHGGRVRAGDPETMLRDSPVAPPLVDLGRMARWEPLPLTVRQARRRAGLLRDALDTGVARASPHARGCHRARRAGAQRSRGLGVLRPLASPVEGLPRPACRRDRGPHGAQRLREVVLAVGAPGHRAPGRRHRRRDGGGPGRAGTPGCPSARGAGAAVGGRPALPRDRRGGVRRRRPAGRCSVRHLPGGARRAGPRRRPPPPPPGPVRRPAAGPGAVPDADRRPAGAPARRAHPRPRLRREARARRRSGDVDATREPRSRWPRTTWSSPPRWPTAWSCSPGERSSRRVRPPRSSPSRPASPLR